ncbi:hypothetical protein PABG_12386 [Paracoccidioides brasiliensis Pb03]|uniref:Uncharacterized protein n=2 Tax=Paracoccidioides brasiliensis TaxID=121759 RepID=C1G2H0_PARBD|nr:uncharacterized protein PADG_02336 [Paracoccidioides brasiliensis Pb18]EEH46186.2 hypothetical protein PADG_02336 [Paracoccidioides brasiliensis Pb18]KGY14703.1 hypothetical protein PABG_12386 [Paracoccidioides brasiliensis Pb03]ODH13505.1 hypothetical protein ACO22_07194 [Paracoccidioides brasiliensis]ODH49693.1 hypothetical protein GX48_04217 [Paracoccidioides brasiliensis]
MRSVRCCWLSDIHTLEQNVTPVNAAQLEITRSSLKSFDPGMMVRQCVSDSPFSGIVLANISLHFPGSQRRRSKSTPSSPRSIPSARSPASSPSTPLRRSTRGNQPEAQKSELQPLTYETVIATSGLKRKGL